MLFKQEDSTQIVEQTFPSNNVGPASRPLNKWLGIAVALIIVAAVLLSGIWSRVRARKALNAQTAQLALTAVSVVSPKQTAPVDEIILPGNVQPFITSPIYARTSGYLRKWYVDIGAHVRKGQLLAVIETPEVDQQLQQSLSNLNTAKANLALADTTKNRYEGMIRSNAVSQQDVDNAVGTYNANKAIVEAIAPKPVNLLIGGPGGLTMRDAAELGARRVSVGGAFARAAWGGFIRSAKELMEQGTFEELKHGASYADLQKLFGQD